MSNPPPADQPHKARRGLFVAIEINLVLWIVTLGTSVAASRTAGTGWTDTQTLLVAGLAFAAIGQHWAFYRLR